MSFTKNRYFKIFLLTVITLNISCMNEKQQPSKWTQYGKWAAVIGAGIVVGLAALKNWWQSEKPAQSIQVPPVGQLPILPLGAVPVTVEEGIAPALPQDMQKIISQSIYTGQTTESLEDAVQRIKSLVIVDKNFNTILSDPKTCLRIIKELAKRFNVSDYTACNTLNTKEAIRRRDLQTTLFELCQWRDTLENDIKKLNDLLIHGVDLNFTYDFTIENYITRKEDNIEVTPLMLSIIKINPNLQFGEPEAPIINKIHLLIASGADINATNKQGLTALMLAALTRNITATKKLCSYKNLTIDQQDLLGNTALIYSLLNPPYHRAQTIFSGITTDILNAGADPELANKNGQTPLEIAEKHLVKDHIKAAIRRKNQQKPQ